MVQTYTSRVGRSSYRGSRSKSVDDLMKARYDQGIISKYNVDDTTSYNRDSKYRSSYKGYSSSKKYSSGGYADKYRNSNYGDKYALKDHERVVSDTGATCKDTKTTKYRIVGRITPSPDAKRKAMATLTLPNVGSKKDDREDKERFSKPSRYDREVSAKERSDSKDTERVRKYTDLSPYGGRNKYSRGSGSPSGKFYVGGAPRPILRRSRSREKILNEVSMKRSRSMNDIFRSPSPPKIRTAVYRQHSPYRGDLRVDLNGSREGAVSPGDGTFPVCSRFPNCSVCIIDIPQNQLSRDEILHNMQHELKEEVENIALLEKKDKEIHLKAEAISQITQMLQKTKKELEIKVSECFRRETEIKQLKQELKAVLSEKKKIEYSHSEQQITISKLESVETKLQQLTVKYDEVVCHNKELMERVKQLEISEKEFIDLERNVIELQVQLRDMEDVELHRDELFQKLQYVKKQRDDFLEKGKLVEEERNEFVRSNKSLEQYLSDWKKKTSEFKKTNQALKDRIIMLEKDKKVLEERIITLQEERVLIQTTLSKVELERDDYVRDVREITLDRNTLEQRVNDLEETLSDYDQLEEGFHSLRLKVAELTRQRDDAEVLIPSYKGKLQVLKKALREKEDTILQLSHDLKTLKIAIENSTFEDISKLKSLNYLSDTSSQYQITYPKHVKSYFHDREPSLSLPSKGVGQSDFDISTESESYDQVVVRPNRYVPVPVPYVESTDSKRRFKGRRCVALFDYDPFRSSTSDHPERELKLREGDHITVFGDMDVDGYLEAEVDGIRGLVPSIYVEELSEDGSVDYRRERRSSQNDDLVRKFTALYDYDPFTMGTTDRPDRQLSLRKGDTVTVFGQVDVDGYYDALKNGKRGLIPSNFVEEFTSTSSAQQRYHSHQTTNAVAKEFEGTIEVEETAGPPYAPRDLKVLRVVTRNAVLLGWDLPPMDEYSQSNGIRVTGYRIWVNGKRKQDCNSSSMTKALVDDVDLNGRVEFSIQSVGENGFCSEKCHFAITGALAALPKDNDFESSSDKYVALYDYDPFKSSPNPNPSLELSFHEGDLIRIYDTSRNDGFYSAEINGKRGLVPSNFIERLGRTHHHHHSGSESDNSRRVQFQKD